MPALVDIVTKGSTSRSVPLHIMDSTDGTPEVGVVFNTSGIDLWYRRERSAKVAITEATLAALTTAYSSGGFLHVSDGDYTLDLPDAAFATGVNFVDYGGTVTGMIVIGGRVRLIDVSLEVANIAANVTQISGDPTAADNLETAFDDTAGAVPWLQITDQGTAQSATDTTVVLRVAAAFGDNALAGATIEVFGSTQGYWQSAIITSNVGSTDTVTVPTWPVTPSGTISYKIVGTAPGSALDAAAVRAAIGLGSANLDTQLGAIDDFLDTEITAIKTKTDFLPSATAGSAGGVFIAGTNAATTITTALTTNLTGNVSGSVGSVTGAVGSVTGAVGSVTAAVSLSAASVDAIWDEPKAGHATANTYGVYLDAAVSGVSTGGVSAADIADAVLDEAMAGHVTAGTLGKAVADILVDTAEIGTAGAGLTALATQASVTTIDDLLDTEVAAIKAKTDQLTFSVTGQVDANAESMNAAAILGNGTSGNKWRGE